MNYDRLDPDWTEFKFKFDLNEAIDKLKPSKILDKILVRIFTCWCPDETFFLKREKIVLKNQTDPKVI